MVRKQTIIIDTNTLLHYKRLDQVDWLKELDASEVDILIPPVVVRELEQQKVRNESKRVRQRAGDYVKWLNSRIAHSLKVDLRAGVSLVILDSEPVLDLALHRLNMEIADDLLIAHAIEWIEGNPSESVAIVTADTGVRMKALGRKLKVILWEDNTYKLAEEEDPDKKEIVKLKRLVQGYENRIPKLEVNFRDGKQDHKYMLFGITEEGSKAELDAVWKAHSPGRKTYADFFDYHGYDWACREHYQAYESYLRQLSQFQQHVIPMELMLANSGTSVADDNDIQLTFPSAFDLRDEYELPHKPTPPDPKDYARSVDDCFDEGHGLFTIRLESDQRSLREDAVKPAVDISKGLVSYKVGKLKHHQSVELGTVYVVFESPEYARSFSVGYKLFSASIPHPVVGTLNIGICTKPEEHS
ncbi:MAG: PIN domain-containing protein [Candidatus Marsarchaeota archaeon]|nr:PIN domain-containing protein [Candidatus Marsarchaeota archaeon]